MAALLGSCPRSHDSFMSGVTTWMHFASKVLGRRGREFPPTVHDLVAWSAHFNVRGTFTNYLGYVRLACQILGVSDAAFASNEVQRAKVAIEKRDEYRRRDPMFVRCVSVALLFLDSCRMHCRQTLLVKLLEMAGASKAAEAKLMAMLFVTTYVFMLRLQSEALPISIGKAADGGTGQQAVLTLEGEEVVLTLERRKNLQRGSVVRRRCWCSTCSQTCPVHAVWEYLSQFGEGVQPFAGIKYKDALTNLRLYMIALAQPKANLFGTQDLRRGHAQDLRAAGASDETLSRAGQWRGKRGFAPYMDHPENDSSMVAEAHENMEAGSASAYFAGCFALLCRRPSCRKWCRKMPMPPFLLEVKA